MRQLMLLVSDPSTGMVHTVESDLGRLDLKDWNVAVELVGAIEDTVEVIIQSRE